MDILRLEKPDFSKIDGVQSLTKYSQYIEKGGRNLVKELSEPDYLYWDKIKYYPLPNEFTPLEVWYIVRQARKFFPLETPIKAENGKFFTYIKLSFFEEWLHRIDMETGGQMFTDYKTMTTQNKEKFLKRGIIEEAIASSQLEGANTARHAAKMMIIQQREPTNPSERMIVNNHRAMITIEEDFKNKKMSLELLFALHRILTDKDSDVAKSEQGRLRTDTDRIIVQKRNSNVIVHIPPKEEFLKEQISSLIDYANDESKSEFVHPLIKAALLHFWIGYLHPFTDGNGRIARAIFYWYMLRKGYWTMMYLPISTVIKKSPAQYERAYVYSEQDGNDVTYFLDYHLKKVMLSLNEFHEYVERKLKENRDIETRLGLKDFNLNDRQKQLLNHLLSDDSYTTAEMHRAIYGVSRLTAYKDLQKLEELGFLQSTKIGTQRRYSLTEKYKTIT
jgi:Fic family protein